MALESPDSRDTIISTDTPERPIRIAAVGDIHCTKGTAGRIETLFGSVHERADVLVLCGDLTDHGTLEEGRVLAEELSALRVPTVAVFGNHDYEAGLGREICAELHKVNVRCLDGVDLATLKKTRLALLERIHSAKQKLAAIADGK